MRGSVAHVAVGHGGSCLLTARATNQLAPLLRIKMRNKLKRSLQDMEECNAEQLDIYDLAIPGMAAGDMLDFDMFELDEEDTCGAATELFRSDMDNLASFLRIDPNNISITLVKPEIKVKEDYVDFENYENGIAAALVTAPRPPKGYISAFNFFAKETRAKLLIMKKYQKMNTNSLNQLIGGLWKKLGTGDRGAYDSMANEDKERYLTQLAVYNESATSKIAPRINAPPGFSFPDSAVSSAPMRTLTAYSIFAQQERIFITNNRDVMPPGVVTHMGHYFGMRWKCMCDEERFLYLQLEQVYKEATTFGFNHHR